MSRCLALGSFCQGSLTFQVDVGVVFLLFVRHCLALASFCQGSPTLRVDVGVCDSSRFLAMASCCQGSPTLQVEVGVVIVCVIVVEEHVAGVVDVVAVVVVVIVAVVVVVFVEISSRIKSLSGPGLILPGLAHFASRCRNCVSRCLALASFLLGLTHFASQCRSCGFMLVCRYLSLASFCQGSPTWQVEFRVLM